MKEKPMKLLLSLFCMLLSIASINAGELIINNMWVETTTAGKKPVPAPQMYLYLDPKEPDSTNIKLDGKPVPNKKYIKLNTNRVTLTWDIMSSGNVSFVVFDKDAIPSNGAKWAMEDTYSLGGFIEFSQLPKDKDKITCDLSNVDGVGLLCGLSGLPSSEGEKAGYNSQQTDFIKSLKAKFPSLPASGAPTAIINGKPYTKIIAPGKSSGADPWSSIVGDYYGKIIDTDRKITLTITNPDNGNWTGTQVTPAETQTNAKANKYSKIGINVPISVVLNGTFKDVTSGAKEYEYNIYITSSAWVKENISKADGHDAVFIRTTNPKLPPIVGDYGTVYKRPTTDTKYYGYDNMHLNPSVSINSTQPFPIQSLAYAISRLCATFQDGYINPQGTTIVYPANTSGKKYGGNPYNDFILANSNSYGQPYSDGQAQVLYHPLKSFELYILSPTDSTTASYYVKGGGQSGGGGGSCEMGFNPDHYGTVTIDKKNITSNTAFSTTNPATITFSKFRGKSLNVDFKAKKVENENDWTALGAVWSVDPATNVHTLTLGAGTPN
jgi:hypothetical protein